MIQRGQLTIPSGEDTEASTVQQSEEVQGKEADTLQQAEETAVVMTKNCQSPSVDVPTKPMDKELSKLTVMKSVQEYKQRFLGNAQEESHHLLKYEKVLAGSWEKTKAGD